MNLDLELFDSNGIVVASSIGTGDEERLDVLATAGQQFQIRIASTSGPDSTYDLKATNVLNRRSVADVTEFVVSTSDDADTITLGRDQGGMPTGNHLDVDVSGPEFVHATRYSAAQIAALLGVEPRYHPEPLR